eukprot:COSAG02_NODE_6_length_64796_cov_76.792865_21_plen_255_part_00
MHRRSGGETNPTRCGRAPGSRGLLRYRLGLGGALSQVTSHRKEDTSSSRQQSKQSPAEGQCAGVGELRSPPQHAAAELVLISQRASTELRKHSALANSTANVKKPTLYIRIRDKKSATRADQRGQVQSLVILHYLSMNQNRAVDYGIVTVLGRTRQGGAYNLPKKTKTTVREAEPAQPPCSDSQWWAVCVSVAEGGRGGGLDFGCSGAEREVKYKRRLRRGVALGDPSRSVSGLCSISSLCVSIARYRRSHARC